MPDPVSAPAVHFGASGAALLAQSGPAASQASQAPDSLGQALDAVNATGLAPAGTLPAQAAAPTPSTAVGASGATPPAPSIAAPAPGGPVVKAPVSDLPHDLAQSSLPPAAPAADAHIGLPDGSGLAVGTGNVTEHVTPPELYGMDNGLLHTGLAAAGWLCVLLGVIFLAYWLLRRFGPKGMRRSNSAMNPRLMGRLMLGSKQSVAVVKVLDRVLVLGATERQITLLHSESAEECRHMDEEADEHAFTEFAEMLSNHGRDGGDDR